MNCIGIFKQPDWHEEAQLALFVRAAKELKPEGDTGQLQLDVKARIIMSCNVHWVIFPI